MAHFVFKCNKEDYLSCQCMSVGHLLSSGVIKTTMTDREMWMTIYQVYWIKAPYLEDMEL